MTDREKLDKISKAVSELSDTNDVSKFIKSFYYIKYKVPKYQPTSRPCFDKPAGVPILHGETLIDNAICSSMDSVQL